LVLVTNHRGNMTSDLWGCTGTFAYNRRHKCDCVMEQNAGCLII